MFDSYLAQRYIYDTQKIVHNRHFFNKLKFRKPCYFVILFKHYALGDYVIFLKFVPAQFSSAGAN